MPAKLQPLSWATSSLEQLPVLPFLAPRLLKPWPSHLREKRPRGQHRQQHSQAQVRIPRVDDMLFGTARTELTSRHQCENTAAEPQEPSIPGLKQAALDSAPSIPIRRLLPRSGARGNLSARKSVIHGAQRMPNKNTATAPLSSVPSRSSIPAKELGAGQGDRQLQVGETFSADRPLRDSSEACPTGSGEDSNATVIKGLQMDMMIRQKLHTVYRDWRTSKVRKANTTEDFAGLFGDVCARLENDPAVKLSQKSIEMMAKVGNPDQIKRLQSLLYPRKNIRPFTYLHIIGRLARQGDTDSAYLMLDAYRESGGDFTFAGARSVATTLLRSRSLNPGAEYVETDIFQGLLEHGVQPNIFHYNVLMHNAIESGDHETAWKIFHMVEDSGVGADAHTYSILFNDAKWRLDRVDLDKIVKTLAETEIRNQYIAGDILKAMWMIHQDEIKRLPPLEQTVANGLLWKRMLSVYETYFEMGPLEDLLPADMLSERDSPIMDGGRKMYPNELNVSLMVQVAQLQPIDLVSLYKRFVSLAGMGHPTFSKLAKDQRPLNGFIEAFGRSPRSLHLCTQVLGDMLEGNRPTETGCILAPPNSETWHWILLAFCIHKQMRAAENVMRIMFSRGFEMDQKIWATLILGYAYSEDEAGMKKAIIVAKRYNYRIDRELLRRLWSLRRMSSEVLEELMSLRDSSVTTDELGSWTP